jgi:dihydropteroate synthase
MGIVNITPDSFSDGGRFLDPDRAVEHALRLLEEGADLLDLGAESTRPGGGVYGDGAREVPAAEEIDRLLPVLERLRPLTAAPLSVDTRKGAVAAAVLAAGADIINDISLLSDVHLARAVAEAGCPLILMHSRGDLATMQHRARYGDLLGEVDGELDGAMARAEREGVSREQIVLDPGIGFAKGVAQNTALIARLAALATLDRPLLLGASRKSFLGRLAAAPDGEPAPPEERLAASLAAAGWGALAGASVVRVHDVGDTVRFLRTWEAFQHAAEDRGDG